MPDATIATTTKPINLDAQTDRNSFDTPSVEENFVRNVDDAPIQENPAGTITDPGIDFPSHQVSTKSEENKSLVDFPYSLPDPAPRPSFHALQEWEGYVIEISETDFTARLIDLTAGATHEEEEATIPRVELSDDDNAKICLGGIFRWVIGYECYPDEMPDEKIPDETEEIVSRIVFRDLPAVTENDLRNSKAWARKMAAFLNP